MVELALCTVMLYAALPAAAQPAGSGTGTGVSSGSASSRAASTGQGEPALRGLSQPLNSQQGPAPIMEEADESFGVSFIKPDEVLVKQPMLKALIQLNNKLSPYQLDASTARTTQLGDVLKLSLQNNLDIKLSNADAQTARWKYLGALGQFLPSVSSGVTYETLSGKYASPFGLLSGVSTDHLSIPVVGTLPLFKGGQLIATAAQQRHAYKAAQYSLKGTTNDVLLDATQLYYNLVLQDVTLQIRIKAVETSAALLARNEDRYANGAVTKLDVLQSRTQLSHDRQALISQQIARRHAAVELATALNLNPDEDLLIDNRAVSKIRLVDEQVPVGNLLQIAIDNRPELKKYDELRRAAKDAIRVAFAPLLPSVNGIIGGITSGARVTSLKGSPPTALGSSAAGAGELVGGSFSTSTVAPTNNNLSTSGVRGRKFTPAELFQIGVSMSWTLGGLGTVQAAEVQSAKWQAHKAQIEFSKQLAAIYKEVRDAYLDVINNENLIAETTEAVNSTREQMSVANIRLDEGVGTDLDAIHAQRDYTQAMIDKASAIINFNVAEAKLLRAIGRVSFESLTSLKPLEK